MSGLAVQTRSSAPKVDRLCTRLVAEGWRVLEGPAPTAHPTISVPELEALAGRFDHVLVRWDRVSMLAVCICDRTAPGSGPAAVQREELVAAARSLERYCNRVHGVRMAAGVEVWEIGHVLGDVEHLHELRPAGRRRGEVHLGAWSLGLEDEQVWTSLPLGGALDRRDQMERLLFALSADDPPDVAAAPPLVPELGSWPWITWALVAALLALFGGQVATVGIAPSVQALYELGGLHGGSVLAGDWHRLVTAMFLHANALHLALNAGPLVVAAATLEGLLGRAHAFALFLLCGVGGTIASIAWNHPRTISVGASGAVIGLLVCGLFVARRLPAGSIRGQVHLQLWWWSVPSLFSTLFAIGLGGVDYAAHIGGACVGAVAGFALLRAGKPNEPAPPLARTARAAAIAGALIVPICFARVWLG